MASTRPWPFSITCNLQLQLTGICCQCSHIFVNSFILVVLDVLKIRWFGNFDSNHHWQSDNGTDLNFGLKLDHRRWASFFEPITHDNWKGLQILELTQYHNIQDKKLTHSINFTTGLQNEPKISHVSSFFFKIQFLILSFWEFIEQQCISIWSYQIWIIL